MTLYRYGMRLRGFSPCCQPTKNFYRRYDDESGEYWDIISYTKQLAETEVKDYSLDYLGKSEVKE